MLGRILVVEHLGFKNTSAHFLCEYDIANTVFNVEGAYFRSYKKATNKASIVGEISKAKSVD